MMKKLFLILLAAMFSFVAFADTEIVEGIEWTYTLSDGKACVGCDYTYLTAIPVYTSGAVSIPSILGGCPVASIGLSAFSGCGELTSLKIPKSVRMIYDWAFEDCRKLTSITIPSEVSNIGVGAFSDCDALTEFIVDSANAAYCAINGMLLTKDGKTLVAGRNGDIAVPEGVMNIGDHAFFCCRGLTSVTMPSSVTNIDTYAFQQCSSLTSVTISSNITNIGKGAFRYCSRLTEFIVDPANPAYRAINGMLLTKDGKTLIAGLNDCVVIPEGVTSIGPYSFEGCSALTSILIPSSVTTIEDYAFYGCKGLTSVMIPSSVNSIGKSGFMYCSELAEILIPSSLMYIGEYAFFSCDRLKTIISDIGDSERIRLLITPRLSGVEFVERQLSAVVPADVTGGKELQVDFTWTIKYPSFDAKFGNDFTAALMKPTGKIGSGGTPMLVWQDYVAGTDPTKEDDVFAASITMVDGRVVISYTPELDDARKAMRKYTTWGKKSLMDTNWTEVREGHEAEYNFFKVSVEMR